MTDITKIIREQKAIALKVIVRLT